ncbi:MAG: helix-turn-helix domain-containing protein [Terracidiphilus sp.]|jgi:excisionase family DNA binding protein
MPQTILSELRSVEETARRLGGVSVWTVYSWLSKGRLRKTKVGSRVMIAESDLQAFIAHCNPEAQAERNEDCDIPARQQ